MWKLRCVFAVCLVAALFSTAAGQVGDAVVLEASTCADLREIFENIQAEKRIVVTKNIRCTREKWPSPVFATNNTVIEGGKFGEGVPSIDWADNTNALIVQRHASISFQSIVLIQDFMQLGGLKLSFATGYDETSIEILGTGVGIRSCPQKLDSLIPLYENLQRPTGVVGDQTISMRSTKKIFVDNVAFVPPTRGDNSTWLICRSVFQCEVNSPLDKSFQRTLNRETLDPSCDSNTNTVITTLSDEDENADAEESDGGSSSGPNGAVIGIVTFLCTAVVLVGVFVAFMVWGLPYIQKRGLVKTRNIDDDAMTSGKFSDTTKSLKTGGTHHSSSVGALTSGVQLTDIELGVPLGKGTMGTVYKGYVNNKPLAVKVVDIEASESFSHEDDPVGTYLAQHLYHANVIETLLYQTHRLEELSRPGAAGDASIMSGGGSLLVDNTLSSINEIRPAEMYQYRTFHVMEFCNLGSLEQAMSNGTFRNANDEPKMLNILRTALDIAKGMCFLHSAKIIHGRLTPANILLKGDSMDTRGFICKVSDFGLTSLQEKQQAIEVTEGRNLSYRAPETLRKGRAEAGSDVFAFGMILWSMLTGKLPFSGIEPSETLSAILEGKRPDVPHSAPFKYERLIKDCWHADTSARPPFGNIIERLTKIVTDLVRGPESISGTPKRNYNSNYASTDMETVIVHGSGSISTDFLPKHRGHFSKSNYASTDMETVIIHGSGSVCADYLLSPKHRGHPRSNYASTDMETVVIHGSGSVCTERLFDSVEYQDSRGYLSPSNGAGNGPFWDGYSAGSPMSSKSDAASPQFDASKHSPRNRRYNSRLEKIDSDRIPEEVEEEEEEEEEQHEFEDPKPQRTNPGIVPSKPSETVSLRYGMASVDSMDDIMSTNRSIPQQ